MQLELFDKEDWQILLEAEEYFKYLQKPNDAFSGMPVCPFLKAEMEKDNLYVDIWRADKKGFYDLFQEFIDSKKDSALFICMDTEAIKWKDVERTKYQKFLQRAIKDTGLKALCLSPWEDFTAGGGVYTRRKSPYFMINIASRQHLSKSHKQLQKSSYFANFTDEELGRLKAKDILKKK